MEYPEFANLMVPVAEYYSRPLTEQAARIYFELVRPIEAATFRDALLAHMADPTQGKFWPTAAHLIDQIAGDDTARERLYRAFDADPTVDGTPQYNARMETIEQRQRRRDRFVKAEMDLWRKLPLPKKIASHRIALEREQNLALEDAS